MDNLHLRHVSLQREGPAVEAVGIGPTKGHCSRRIAWGPSDNHGRRTISAPLAYIRTLKGAMFMVHVI